MLSVKVHPPTWYSEVRSTILPPLLCQPSATWWTKLHKLSLCYFWWTGEDTSKHLHVKPVHAVIPAEVL